MNTKKSLHDGMFSVAETVCVKSGTKLLLILKGKEFYTQICMQKYKSSNLSIEDVKGDVKLFKVAGE